MMNDILFYGCWAAILLVFGYLAFGKRERKDNK
jgi:hypothetical protein